VIRHIVALQLASTDPVVRREQAATIKERLEELVDVDPGVLAITVFFDLGEVATHWPLVLVSDFSTAQSLDAYQMHPRHRAVVEWMNQGVVSDRAVIDFAVA